MSTKYLGVRRNSSGGIGRPTIGAALPSVIERLPTGARLQYAIGEYRTPKGFVLEGRGAQPDAPVEITRRDGLPSLCTLLFNYVDTRTHEGDELEKIKHQAIFNPELKWRELFIKAELAGKEKVGGQDAYVFRLTGKDGATVTRYYDAATFLLLRADAVDEGPQGKIPVETLYMDYREVDGVKTAFQWTQKTPVGETIIKITEVKTNAEIDDARFAKPSHP